MTDSIRPLILISNDDGITAEGIHVLARVASQLGDVVVVAPDGPRSGGSSALTWGTILRPERHADYCGAEMWSLNGTPVDCIKLALHAICNRRPSLVLAGINHDVLPEYQASVIRSSLTIPQQMILPLASR